MTPRRIHKVEAAAAMVALLVLGGCGPQDGLEVSNPPALPAKWAAEIIQTPPRETLEPIQRNLTDSIVERGGEISVTYLAEFELQGRVLRKKRYRTGREGKLSPFDFVIVWDSLADPAVYKKLKISQRNRWWYYRHGGDFAEPERIPREGANMHLIPASDAVFESMDRVSEGDIIRLRGHLVDLRHSDGWSWSSSMTRFDKGNGACELIEVQKLEVVSSR